MNRLHQTSISTMLVTSLAASLSAQDTWIAGWGSADLFRVSPGGVVEQRIPLSSFNHRLRAVRQAPDGKLWVMFQVESTTFQFDGQFLVLDADGSNPTPHSLPTAGNPGVNTFDIAFDSAGHAWITDAFDKVFEYDANVNLLNTYQLAEFSPLGVAVDANDNVWIAHREGPPGKVSRIDGVTRNVTIHRMPPGSRMIPTKVYPDFRGVGNPSHIWVVGDNVNGSDLVELDAAGRVVSNGAIDLGATGNHQALVRDASGIVWIGDFRTGDLLSYDPSTGIVSNVINLGYPILGLANGPFGGIWASLRPMSGRSLLRRVDPATGTTEIELEIGFGVLQDLDTRFPYVHVVDPTGDDDADGTISILEINDGLSAIDPCSTPSSSISTSGSSRIGTTLDIEMKAPSGVPSAIAFSVGTGLTSPGIQLPGVGCSFALDLATLLPSTVTTVGAATLPLPIPADSGLDGLVLRFQALSIGASPQFSNLGSALVFM